MAAGGTTHHPPPASRATARGVDSGWNDNVEGTGQRMTTEAGTDGERRRQRGGGNEEGGQGDDDDDRGTKGRRRVSSNIPHILAVISLIMFAQRLTHGLSSV